LGDLTRNDPKVGVILAPDHKHLGGVSCVSVSGCDIFLSSPATLGL